MTSTSLQDNRPLFLKVPLSQQGQLLLLLLLLVLVKIMLIMFLLNDAVVVRAAPLWFRLGGETAVMLRSDSVIKQTNHVREAD